MNRNPIEVPPWVEGALRERAIPERREVTRKYFPTSMEILGVPAPEIRKVVGRLLREMKGTDPGLILDLALGLKRMNIHECRQAAYELLDRRRDARSLVKVRKLRALGEGNDNWASVDGFSVLVAGQLWREGRIPDREVMAWAGSADRWWRRAALVSTVPLNMTSRGGAGDVPRTLRVCAALAVDRDPMVAKALSWALRALVPVDRGAVEGFLNAHGEGVAALVRREVRNKLLTGRKSGGERAHGKGGNP